MKRSDVSRVSPDETRSRLQAGQAMLVCGYEADEKFRSVQLEGAVSYNRFLELLPAVGRDQELIFYCA